MSRLNHKRMRFLGVSAATIISVYALVGVMLAGALPKFLVQAQGPSDHTIYIPLSQGFSSAVAGEATHEEAEDTATNADPSPGEEWATHTSATGGYSFRYPANWKIEESKRGVLQLVPPAELLEEKI